MDRIDPGFAGESGPHAGVPHHRLAWGPFLWAAVQLGLVLGVAFLYRIELERGFGVVAALTFAGFLVHSWLPLQWRLKFFLFLTLVAIAVLLEWNGIWLVALGLTLLGLGHLRVNWWLRISLIIAVTAGLAVVQAGWVALPWASAVIPVLGAMFMFRFILYVYDLKTDRTPATLWQRLAYFFMLPNVCFPLFPVVDYKTFLNSYYDIPAGEIYQKGLFWMLRGVTHLMLYRLVYLYFLPRADSDLSGALGVYLDLSGVLGVFAFMAMTYALYLRVSGLFHLIVGILCLFGFNLPATNNHYFLASSFTDLWRRINIYWKDFMMTTVFYPTFLGTRHWGMTARLVVATATVFLVTWFLHSYQWFWLQGVFPVTGTDVAFWGLLGLALAANSVWESRRGRRRKLGEQDLSWRARLRISAQTLGVFTTMAVLWTLWDSGSFSEWGYRLLRLRDSSMQEWVQFGVLLISLLLVGSAAQALESRGWGFSRAQLLVRRQAACVIPIVSLGLLALWFPAVHQRLGGPIQSAVVLTGSNRPNPIDEARRERGYYETLSRTSSFNPQVGELDFQLAEGTGEFYRDTRDVRRKVLIPGLETTTPIGGRFTTNRWGMRDRDYEMAKPPGTFRIALLGASYEMASREGDDETFENLIEDRLNLELGRRGFERYEILNFAVDGYGLLQTLYVASRVVPPFDADVVMYVAHPQEGRRLFQRLRTALNSGVTLDDEFVYVAEILRAANANGRMPESEFIRRLRPYEQDLIEWTYKQKIEAIRSQDALPVFLYMPQTHSPFERSELRFLSGISEENRAVNLIINDVFDGHVLEDIRRNEWDDHPNAIGHRIIADRIYGELLENADAIGLVPTD